MAAPEASGTKSPPLHISDDATPPRDESPAVGSSDGEGGERTAREKLKKTSIAGLQQHSLSKPGAGPDTADPVPEAVGQDSTSRTQTGNGLRGRPSKKRSFEDLHDDSAISVENGGPPLPKKGQHKRMRSRESANDQDIQGVDTLDDAASPIHEESDAEAEETPGGPGVLVTAPLARDAAGEGRDDDDAVAAGHNKETAPEPANTASRSDQTTSAVQSPTVPKPGHPSPPAVAASGFANASVTSPFSSLTSPKSPSREHESAASPSTSDKAFASSGIAAFASSEKSPFGAAGATAKAGGGFGGGFGGGGDDKAGFKSGSGAFGGASAFGSTASSGFGSGGGFASAGSFGAPSAFGSSAGFGAALGSSRPFGSAAGGSFAKAKPIGATNDEDDESSEHGDGDADDDAAAREEEEAHQDPRFKEQDLGTGEENEDTIFQCRAKLYHFEKEWKERGAGVLKINVRYEARTLRDVADDDESEDTTTDRRDVELGAERAFATLDRKARLIMRTDGVHRLVLNTPVFKDMNVGTHDGKEPSGRTMHLTGLEDGKPTGYQIKVGKEDALKEIYHKIRELQEEL